MEALRITLEAHRPKALAFAASFLTLRDALNLAACSAQICADIFRSAKFWHVHREEAAQRGGWMGAGEYRALVHADLAPRQRQLSFPVRRGISLHLTSPIDVSFFRRSVPQSMRIRRLRVGGECFTVTAKRGPNGRVAPNGLARMLQTDAFRAVATLHSFRSSFLPHHTASHALQQHHALALRSIDVELRGHWREEDNASALAQLLTHLPALTSVTLVGTGNVRDEAKVYWTNALHRMELVLLEWIWQLQPPQPPQPQSQHPSQPQPPAAAQEVSSRKRPREEEADDAIIQIADVPIPQQPQQSPVQELHLCAVSFRQDRLQQLIQLLPRLHTLSLYSCALKAPTVAAAALCSLHRLEIYNYSGSQRALVRALLHSPELKLQQLRLHILLFAELDAGLTGAALHDELLGFSRCVPVVTVFLQQRGVGARSVTEQAHAQAARLLTLPAESNGRIQVLAAEGCESPTPDALARLPHSFWRR